jgi:uncharacterized pyridoxal phosphate-dependent enzyme
MGIYEQIGIKRYINAMATVTFMGGSLMSPEVLDAMREASRSFVSVVDLQHKAGALMAEWTNNEAAMVSNGAAAGMVLAAAACMAGDDQAKRDVLPYTEGMANEILVYGHAKCGYDFALRQAGARIVGYGSAVAKEEELEVAITEKIAAVFIFYFEHRMAGQLPVGKVVEIAHRHGIPVFVDAAAQLPARENLWKFTRDWGADLAIFSGGKGLCGPQSSGLVVGKKDYIERMISFSCPNGGIGRPMKVGKEEIVGLMTAVRLYMEKDMDAEMADWESQVQSLLDAFADESAVVAVRDFPSEAGQPNPRAKVSLVEGTLKADGTQLAAWLKDGDPGVIVAVADDALFINPQTMQPGEMKIVIRKIREAIDFFRQ